MLPQIGLLTSLLLSTYVLGAPPVITNYDKVASLYEGATTNMILSKVTCLDPDGDKTRVYVDSVSPQSSCRSCFEALDCPPDECVQYRAGVGTLSYTAAQMYELKIACTDNKEKPVFQVVQVNIKPNSAPYFDPPGNHKNVPVTGSEAAGTQIATIGGKDDEGDSITYSMTVEPITSAGNYRIDPVTGEIFTTVDLRKECRNDVTLSVTITDSHTTTGQPMTISVPKSNPNVAPVIMNCGSTIMIPEDSTGIAYTMKITDGNGDPVTTSYTTDNPAGTDQFKMGGTDPNIYIVKTLNYEDAALRESNIVMVANDSYCLSEPCNMKLRVTDVNEPPVITPVDSKIVTCEGKHDFDTGKTVTDPDVNDKITWSIDPRTDNPGLYTIDPINGKINIIVELDVDGYPPFRIVRNSQVFYLIVTDIGGLSATTTLTINFKDCNDNACVIDQAGFEFSATECTKGGTQLGKIAATDKDKTSTEGNNVLYFEGSGGAVQVGTGGEVIVNHPLPAGSVSCFNAYCYDRGIDPGPLRSVQPSVVCVRFTPCPTTPPPTAAPPVTTTTTTTTTTAPATAAVKKYTRTDDDPNLPWIIIAALLGAFFLGLLTYMLWRYGSLCCNTCQNLNCGKACRGGAARRRKVEERPVEEFRREPMRRRRPPSRPPSETPSEEKDKDPEKPGFIFGFNKIRYHNDDVKYAVNDKGLPAPTDMDYHYPHTFDPVEPAAPTTTTSPQVPAADVPKKRCIIQ